MQRPSGRLRGAPYRHAASVHKVRCAPCRRGAAAWSALVARQLQRARIGVVALGAGEPRGQRGRLARRELGQQHLQRGVELRACRRRLLARAAPSTTTRDFAAREIRVAARLRAELASVPRYTVSKTLVSSRATAARRAPPNAAAMSSRHSAMRCGASKNTSVRASAASSASRARRSASRAGRNPSNVNRSVGRPAMTARRLSPMGPAPRRCSRPPARRAAPARSPDRTAAACRRRSPARCARRRAVSPAVRRCARSRCARAATPADATTRVLSAIAPSCACLPPRPAPRRRVLRARAAKGRRDCRSASRSPQDAPGSQPLYFSPRMMPGTREGYSTYDCRKSSEHTSSRFCWPACSWPLLLAGCPSTPRRGGLRTSIAPRKLTRSGNHAGAAALYERLRPKPPAATASNSGCARHAPGWPRAGRPTRIACSRAAAAGSRNSSSSSRRLLRIQSAVAQGRGDEAWREVSSMQAPDGAGRGGALLRNPPAGGHRHGPPGRRHPLRAVARTRSSRPATHARARSELLAQLRAAAERGVSLTPPPGSDATVRGWLEAASVARGQRAQSHAGRHAARGVPHSLSRRIRRWRRCRANRASASRRRRRALEAAPHLALHAAAHGPHRRRRPRRSATAS